MILNTIHIIRGFQLSLCIRTDESSSKSQGSYHCIFEGHVMLLVSFEHCFINVHLESFFIGEHHFLQNSLVFE